MPASEQIPASRKIRCTTVRTRPNLACSLDQSSRHERSQQRDLAMRRSLRTGSACVLGRVENAMRTRVKSNHAEQFTQNGGTFGERRTT